MKLSPNYALDLSQEQIVLWFKGDDGAWLTAGTVAFDDPKRDSIMAKMRAKAGIEGSKQVEAQVRIPRSEVLVTKVNIPSDKAQADQQLMSVLENLTPYKIDELSYDTGEASGQMTPLAAVAIETLQQAEEISGDLGFKPAYFTTKCNASEFPDQPAFFLNPPKAVRPVAWIAGAGAVFAAILMVGGLALFNPDNPSDTGETIAQTPEVTAPEVEETAVVEEAVPEETVAVAPQLSNAEPTGLLAQTPELSQPETGSTPMLDLSRFDTVGRIDNVALLETAGDLGAALPPVELPPRPISNVAPAVEEVEPVLPQTVPDELVASIPDAQEIADQIADVATSGTADTDAEGLSAQEVVDAAPIVPSVEGTPGPEGILVFAGRPPVTTPARERVVEPNPLAGFAPAARPVTQAPVEVVEDTPVAQEAPEQEAPEVELSLLEQADPALAEAAPAARPEPPAAPTLLELADPALADERPATRPEVAGVETPEAPVDEPAEVVQQVPEPTLLESANSALAGLRPATRPAPKPAPTLLELADPALAGSKPESRPVVEATAASDEEESSSLLDQADTTLAGIRPSSRAVEGEAEDIANAQDENPNAVAVDTSDALASAEQNLLDLADPALASAKPNSRPLQEEKTIEVASIDPALLGARPASRPNDIASQPLSILERANPSLRGEKPAKRPAVVEKPAEKIIEPTPETQEQARLRELQNNSSRFAVKSSPEPNSRPRSLSRTVKKTLANVQTASVEPTESKPKRSTGIPTTASVAKAALDDGRINKREMNLIGVFGKPSARSALVRMPTGRYVKVKQGTRFSGWQVAAIGESSIRLKKGSRTQVLRLPKN